VTELEFGEKPKRFRYAVIVCPNCRKHAQITEIGKNTLSCQHCGVTLQARKMRVLYSSEELADAVAFRTRLQAEISGKEDEISKYENEGFENKLKIPGNGGSDALAPKKDPKSILLELLEASGGKIRVQELQQKALENRMSQEKFGIILKKLLETGELYSPEPGMIKMV
jgi:ribosomal protein S27E